MSKAASGGGKKIGRHKTHCARYRSENRREKNKARVARKIAKMLAKKSKKKGGVN